MSSMKFRILFLLFSARKNPPNALDKWWPFSTIIRHVVIYQLRWFSPSHVIEKSIRAQSTNNSADIADRRCCVCPCVLSSEPHEGLSADFDDAERPAAANQRRAARNQPIGSRLKQDTSPCNYSSSYCNSIVLLRLYIWRGTMFFLFFFNDVD